ARSGETYIQRTPSFRPFDSSSRRSESKTPRKPASVFPLPVGEVSRIDSWLRTEGTQSNWAWVKPGKLAKNQSRKRGCSLSRSDFTLPSNRHPERKSRDPVAKP